VAEPQWFLRSLHELEPQGSYVWVRPFSAGSGLPNLRERDICAYTDADTERNSDGAKSYCDAYTDSASSVANRDRDRNIYTYFDTETFTNTKSCANAQSSSDSAAAPVAFKFAQSIGRYKRLFPIPETQSAFLPLAQ
jgi:hypothetical protein